MSISLRYAAVSCSGVLASARVIEALNLSDKQERQQAMAAVRDGLERYGPRAWSSQVVKRLEDDCGEDLRAPGFPEYLVDHEPGGEGAEVVIANRRDYVPA